MVKEAGVKEENEVNNLHLVMNNIEPYASLFYKKYDRLIWDISNKWCKSLKTLSKNNYDLEDIHNYLWTHVLEKLPTYDSSRGTKISSWIFLICNSKAGMIKRNLETKKNSIAINEINSLNVSNKEKDKNTKIVELFEMIGKDYNIDEEIVYQEFILDFIYSLLELIDACTDKERKIYLLKIKGRSQNEISEEAKVSKSYIPKVFKRLGHKFKTLYESIDEQEYVDKKERDSISKDLLGAKSIEYISEKYSLEYDTICICKEILDIVGL